MEKRQIAKKALSFFLTALIFLTVVTGCGKKSDKDPVEEAKKVSKDYIYKQEVLEEIARDDEVVAHIDYVGGKVKVVTRSEMGNSRCISFNPDGTDVQSFDFASEKGKRMSPAYCTFDNDGNLYMVYDLFDSVDQTENADDEGDSAGEEDSAGNSTSEGTSDAAADTSSDDGVAQETENKEGTESSIEGENNGTEGMASFFVKIDATGKEIFKVDLTKEFSEEDFFYSGITWNEKYGVLFCSSKGVEKYDEQSGFSVLVDTKALGDSYMDSSLYSDKSGENIFLLTFGEGYKINICKLDIDNKKIDNPIEYSEDNIETIFFGEGYDLYLSCSESICGYNAEDNKVEKLVDFNDSSIGLGSFTFMDNAVAISESEIIADIPNNLDDDANICRLTKVRPEDVIDKTQITLGGLYMDTLLTQRVMDFNRKNDKYIVKLIDYANLYSDSYEEAAKQFKLDVTSGKAPDIISVDSLGVSVDSLVNKGIILDLTSQFEQGGALSEHELLPNIDKLMRVDDKIYSIIPYYTVSTYVIRDKFAEGKTSLTYEECDELIQKNNTDYKKAFGPSNYKEDLISYIWMYNRNEFIDWDNKKCDFNNQEFIGLLNFINKFPPVPKNDNGQIFDDTLINQDKQIFYQTFWGGIYDYAYTKQVQFNDEIAFIGFPNNLGKNCASVYPGCKLSVNSKTSNTEGVYEFLETLFNTSDDSSIATFSSDKAVFESAAQDATKEFDGSSDEAYFTNYMTGDKIKKKPLSQEEVKKFCDYVVSIDTLYEVEGDISKIISEEASALFEGQKSAEEVAEIIQNRVNVYINENS